MPLAAGHQVRLLLHTAAYWLMLALRDAIPKPQPLANAEFTTLRLRLVKIAARVVDTATRVRIDFAATCPEASCSPASPAGSNPPRRDTRGNCPSRRTLSPTPHARKTRSDKAMKKRAGEPCSPLRTPQQRDHHE